MKNTLGLILVGAGASRRMEKVDKVWAPLGDHPIIWHSLSHFASLAARIVLVVRNEHVDRARELACGFGPVSIVTGGTERQQSVSRGLAELHHVDVVAVHDAARPFATSQMLSSGLSALGDNDGAVPVVPVADTVKVLDGDRIRTTLDREQLRAVQTPQVFRAQALIQAHERARIGGTAATDDAQLLEVAGFRVVTFAGDPANFKITTPADLERARLVVAAHRHT